MNKLATLQSNSTISYEREAQSGFPQNKKLFNQSQTTIQDQLQEIQDQIERDIAEIISQKQDSNYYLHLGSENHSNNIYKGNLVPYHEMAIPIEIEENLSEISSRGFLPEIWTAYYCFQRTIIFWLFEPKQSQKADLNYYFNPSKFQPFPSAIKVQKFQLDSPIMSIALSRDSNQYFKLGNDYLLCIASKYSVSLYKLRYQNVQISDCIFLNYQINTNGEEIYCMTILNDSILMGGSSGNVKRVFWKDGQMQRKQVGIVDVVSQQLKKLINFSKKYQRVTQIDVDPTRKLAYALVEVSDGQNLKSQVQIYTFNDTFEKITTIEQHEIIRRNLQIIDPQAFIFSYIKALIKTEVDCHLLIVTLNGYQILISLNQQEDINHKEEDMIRINGSFEIRSCLQSACTFNQVPFGVMADDKRWNIGQSDVTQVEQKYIDGVYADEGVFIIQKSDKLFCGYPDQGQLSFQQFLDAVMQLKSIQCSKASLVCQSCTLIFPIQKQLTTGIRVFIITHRGGAR